MQNKMRRIFQITFISAGLIIFSCDDRLPENSESSSAVSSDAYNLTVTAQAYGFDSNNNAVAVGEDLEGPFVTTFVSVLLTDSLNQPQNDEMITFSAKASGSDIGSFDTKTPSTNNDG